MEIESAVQRLSALAQHHRLAIFRLLVQQGPDGLPAGEIATRLGLAPNALSFHLKELSTAGLVRPRPSGRYVFYAPDFEAMNGLLDFLTENCCAGSAGAASCQTDSHHQEC